MSSLYLALSLLLLIIHPIHCVLLSNLSTIVNDPLGNSIHLPRDICLEGGPEKLPKEIYDEYRNVIETPACIIEMQDGSKFYFRSIGWDFTVLIEVSFKEEKWNAIRCLKNPPTTYIQALLKDGNFIAGSSIG